LERKCYRMNTQTLNIELVRSCGVVYSLLFVSRYNRSLADDCFNDANDPYNGSNSTIHITRNLGSGLEQKALLRWRSTKTGVRLYVPYTVGPGCPIWVFLFKEKIIDETGSSLLPKSRAPPATGLFA